MTACFHHAPHPHTHDERSGHARDRSVSAPTPKRRDYGARSFTVGIGGPVGSGKTALLLALCRKLRDRYQLGVVTNDIFTKEDAEFLMRHDALPSERIRAVETGGCPHTAIRDDISPNLVALDALMESLHPELLFVESGGDNLAAQFSRDLADYTIYVIDVSGGDKIPRKGRAGHHAVGSAHHQQDGSRAARGRRPRRDGTGRAQDARRRAVSVHAGEERSGSRRGRLTRDARVGKRAEARRLRAEG